MSFEISEDVLLSKTLGSDSNESMAMSTKSETISVDNLSFSNESTLSGKSTFSESDDRPSKKLSDPGKYEKFGKSEEIPKSKSRGTHSDVESSTSASTVVRSTSSTTSSTSTTTTTNRTRNSSSSTNSSRASRLASEHNSRSHSPRLNTSLSLDGADSRPLRFEIGPPIDPTSYIGIQQENYSSTAYGGLSHHGMSRLSSLNGSDFVVSGLSNEDAVSVIGVPIFDERMRKLEDKNSSGELYATPPSQSGTPPLYTTTAPSLAPSSTATTPTTSGPGSLSSNGVRKKKSSWKNSLYPTYKSRSSEFKRLFTDLPPEERLIVDFSCALQKDILVHGRLYSTMNYLCFYANIFRCKTLIAIRWEDVTKVTKEKMALVFPNAIQISTKTDKHFFTSFAARDKTYTMLFKLWLNAQLHQSAPSAEMWQWVHSFYGEELGLTSDDEPDYVSPFGGVSPSTSALLACEESPQFVHSSRLSKSATSPGNLSESIFENANSFNSSQNTTGNSSRSNTSSETGGGSRPLGKIEESGGCHAEAAGEEEGSDGSAGQTGPEAGGRGRPSSLSVTADQSRLSQQQQQQQQQQRRIGVTAIDGSRLNNNNNINVVGLCVSDLSDMSSESDSEFPQGRFNGESEDLFSCAKSDSMGRNRPRVTLDSWRGTQDGREMTCQTFPIDVDTLFALLFTNSEFYIDFHTARKTIDIVQSPWQLKDDGSNDKIREVSFTLSLTNAMGYKQSQVTETQVMTHESYPGQIYIVNVETVNSGIPYAESFYVTSNFCLSRVDDRQSNLTVFSGIKYKKAVWGLVKTFIEKNTWAGLEDFYSNLSRSLLIVSTDLSRGKKPLTSKKSKKRSGRGNALSSSSQFEASQPFVEVIENGELSIPTGLNVKRVSTSTINGVLVGDYGSHSIRPPSSSAGFGNSAPVTSSYSGGNNFLFKIILFLLSTLLIANMLLFFRLYNLEARLIQPDDNSDGQLTPDPTLFFVKQGVPKTEEDWVKLVQRQEMLHQLELEKWHDLLGTATHLLRQTEESLTDLQRTIHPLALKKLRHLLFLQNTENPPDGVNMDSQDLHPSSEPEKVHHNNNNNNNNNVENQSNNGGSESDVRSQKKVPISNDKREL